MKPLVPHASKTLIIYSLLLVPKEVWAMFTGCGYGHQLWAIQKIRVRWYLSKPGFCSNFVLLAKRKKKYQLHFSM